jgi:hypothetical protein
MCLFYVFRVKERTDNRTRFLLISFHNKNVGSLIFFCTLQVLIYAGNYLAIILSQDKLEKTQHIKIKHFHSKYLISSPISFI